MPIVGYGDPVYAEHFNLHLRALRALIELEEWIATAVCSAASDLLAAINDVKYYADQLSEKGSGDVVSSRDWNALKLAVGLVQKMDDAANACLLQSLEPEFPRLRLYDSTSKITVYCTKNPRTHYGKESGMPANYVYTYWFEESYDWEYDDAMVRIYWEPPYWRLEIYKGEAHDVHNWYYDNTLIVGNLTDTYPRGVYKLHAVVWLDAVTKDLVKYEVY